MQKTYIFPFHETPVKTTIIDGKKTSYDMCCSDEDLEECLNNPNFKKIGEGCTCFIDGREQTFNETLHFFVRI